MKLEQVELRLVSLPTREVLAASHDAEPPANRELVFVHVRTDIGDGWGECSALNRPTYTAEYAQGCFATLRDQIVPGVIAQAGQGDLVTADAPMAAAGITIAVNDVMLKARGVSLASELGAAAASVPAGAALGLADVDTLVARAEALVDQGFGRIKLKIQPGHDFDVLNRLAGACPTIRWHLDANGSYAGGSAELLAGLAARPAVDVIEQPFAVDEDVRIVRGFIQLVAIGSSPAVVVHDESIGSLEDALRLHAAGALGGVSVKAPRLGSLGGAKAMHDWCVGEGVAMTAGGMLESGLGRHALAALAALPGFRLVGDVSPARRWLAADPWPDLTIEDGRVVVPTGPGVAPPPDLDVLDRYTLEQVELRG